MSGPIVPLHRPSRNNGTVSGATWSFCRSQVWLAADIFMCEIPGGTRARHRSRPVDCPDTDTDHSNQSVPVLFAPLFLDGRNATA